jgi:hypothetical protein
MMVLVMKAYVHGSTGYSGTLCGSHCSTDITGTYIAEAGNNCFAASFVITRTSDSRAEVNMFDTSGGIAPEIDFTGDINADCTSITLDATAAVGSFPGISEGIVTITGNSISVYLLANAGDSCTATASK